MWYFYPVTVSKPSRHLLDAPWFYRLGFAAGRAVPKGVLYRVADVVGELSRLGYPARDAAVRGNLRRVFPDAPGREIARLSRAVFRNFTRSMVDYGRFRSMSPEAIHAEIREFEGREHLDAALSSGRGIVLVTGHIGNWELGSFHFGLNGLKTNVVTIREGRPEIDALRESHRVDHNVRTLLMDDGPLVVIDMMAALKRREVVALLVDRWGEAEGIPVAFFGGAHRFPRGPFALSRATGAIILTAFVVRDGAGYKVIVEPPFEASGDEAGDARKVAGALERVIRRYPDQWYNFTPVV
jgi:KDO2-lipid IV(A) lauroyltransferase